MLSCLIQGCHCWYCLLAKLHLHLNRFLFVTQSLSYIIVTQPLIIWTGPLSNIVCESRPHVYLRYLLQKSICIVICWFVRSNICRLALRWSGYCWDDRGRLWGTTRDQSQMLLRIQSLLFCDQEVGIELKMFLLWMKLNKTPYDEVSKSCVSIFQDQSEMFLIIQTLLFWPVAENEEEEATAVNAAEHQRMKFPSQLCPFFKINLRCFWEFKLWMQWWSSKSSLSRDQSEMQRQLLLWRILFLFLCGQEVGIEIKPSWQWS